MTTKQETYLRIDNLKCNTTKCKHHRKGYSFLPSHNFRLPEVYCGNCGGRIHAEFMEVIKSND